jgi:hypothetical protein
MTESGHKHQKKDKPHVTLPGIVDKIIPAINPANGYDRPEKVQIAVEGAEPHYAEIQVDNTFRDDVGRTVHLKLGAEVEITIEATTTDTAQTSVDSELIAAKKTA